MVLFNQASGAQAFFRVLHFSIFLVSFPSFTYYIATRFVRRLATALVSVGHFENFVNLEDSFCHVTVFAISSLSLSLWRPLEFLIVSLVSFQSCSYVDRKKPSFCKVASVEY